MTYGPARNHPTYWAFVAHRASGLGLALFLPVHFYVLAMAVEESAFNSFVDWTDQPLVKFAEAVLVGLLAVHMAGGLRLLALEFIEKYRPPTPRIVIAFGAGAAAIVLFLAMAR
jgi:fumarate reductase subunit D